MHKAGLDQKMEASQETAISLAKPECLVEPVQEKLSSLHFETRRIAPEAVDVEVSIGGHNSEAIGVIPVPAHVIATPQTRFWGHSKYRNPAVQRACLR